MTILRSSDVSDGKGGFTTSWTPLATVWAEMISLNGREAVLAQSLQGISSYRINIRWRGDVRTTDQICYAGKRLNIRSADDPDERREQLVIFADSASIEG